MCGSVIPLCLHLKMDGECVSRSCSFWVIRVVCCILCFSYTFWGNYVFTYSILQCILEEKERTMFCVLCFVFFFYFIGFPDRFYFSLEYFRQTYMIWRRKIIEVPRDLLNSKSKHMTSLRETGFNIR